MLTNEQLAAILERCDRASKGPWTAQYWERVRPADGRDDGSDDICHVYGHRHELENFNRTFIAHARTDIPLLLAEIARLQSLLYSHARHSDECCEYTKTHSYASADRRIECICGFDENIAPICTAVDATRGATP